MEADAVVGGAAGGVGGNEREHTVVLMKVLANIAVNLQAAGPAATLIAWIIGVTRLDIFGGDGTVAKSTISALTVVGIILVIAFAQPPSR